MTSPRQPNAGGSSDATGLIRVLGRMDVMALAFGAMIGWSWVVLAGDWLAAAGTGGAVLAFGLGTGVMLLIGLIYAELAAALPFAGGEHVYSQRALGRDASFLCTWAIVLGYVSVSAFEAVALPTVVAALLPGMDALPLWSVAGWTVTLPWLLVGMGGAVLITGINVIGVRTAAQVQTGVVLVILLGGAVLLAGGMAAGDGDRLAPLLPAGMGGVAGVMVMVPFLFVGFDVIPQAAEEIDLPRRRIGQLLVLSIALAGLFYVGVMVGVGLLLPASERPGDVPVAARALGTLLGEPGRLFMLCAGLAGILTSWNAFLLGGSRALFALARAGQLPAFLGRLHPRWHTPVNAILMVGGLSLLAPLFGRPALVWLVDAGGFGIVIAYAGVVISFLVLRRREPDLPRPFTVPAGGIVGSIALLASLALLWLYLPFSPSALTLPEWIIVLGWSLLGVALWTLTRQSTATEASDR